MSQELRPLQHNPEFGEVDPRTYPLICKVHLGCSKVGTHERVIQIQRLMRVLDGLFEEEGESQARLHFTAEPGVDVKKWIEVRAQCQTCRTDKDEQEKVKAVIAQMDLIREAGERMGWTLVEQ